MSSEWKTEFIGNDFAGVAACELRDPRQHTCKGDEEHIPKVNRDCLVWIEVKQKSVEEQEADQNDEEHAIKGCNENWDANCDWFADFEDGRNIEIDDRLEYLW